MQSSPPPAGLPDPLSDELRWLRRLSLPLRAAALALFVNFVLGVVAANFPPRWAEPGWYLNLSTTLVNGATLPLMGLCLLQVVAFLERGLEIDQGLLERSRYLAFWAALGFALLLPLLGWTSWRVLQTASAGDAKQTRLALEAIDRVEALSKRADLQAPDLRRELEAIPGLQLSADFFTQPLPRQRRNLSNNAQRGRTQLIEQGVGRRNQRLLVMARNWLRVPFSCLVYALAYGAFARRSGTTRPVYEELAQLGRQLRLSRLKAWLEDQERLALEEEQQAQEMSGRPRPPRGWPRRRGQEPWDDDDPSLPRP
jgi:hypothetical protein